MKQIAIFAMTFAFPFLAMAADAPRDHQREKALHHARELAQTLKALSEDATEHAHKAHKEGHKGQTKKLRDLSYKAENLSREVRETVVHPLHHGEPMRKVRHNLDRLDPAFHELHEEFKSLHHQPSSIKEKMERQHHHRRELKDILSHHR